MNIKLSYNWIKEFVPTKLTAQNFAARISRSGPTIERMDARGDEWEKVVVGHVIKIKPHPNADKLRIALTDVGTEVVQIVCGGTNLCEGMRVAVALPGARVRWHGKGDQVVLEATEIRGEKSHGMICAADEIGLFDYFPHAEREIMDLSGLSSESGTPIAGALGLKDTIFDIEVTSNRVDVFSVAGFAREAGAILGLPSRAKRRDLISARLLRRSAPRDGMRVLDVRIQSKLCHRYMGAMVRGVTVGPSPWWMCKRLLDAGIRPINNLVDITNYVMMETGQPMHVFDLKKLEPRKENLVEVVVRQARSGEVLKALDGKDYQLDASMLVIADAQRPIAIAGVMGGEESGVTEKTTDVIFECANFDPVSVRKTARALNLHSESSQRFEKNLSPEEVPYAMSRALEFCRAFCGDAAVSGVADKTQKTAHTKKFRSVLFRASAISDMIGLQIPAARQKAILKSLGFEVRGSGDRLRAQVPWWRARDIEGEHDIVEEVARLYGYHNLPAEIPSGAIPSRPRDPEFGLEREIKDFFRGAGWIEAQTYSFVSKKIAGYDRGEAHLTLVNPLSDDLTHMRQGITPSLLAVVEKNQGEFPSGMVFELARAYVPRPGELPDEQLRLAGVVWSKEADGTQFFRAKGALDSLFSRLGVHAHFTTNYQLPITNYHDGRSLGVMVNDKVIGSVGEVHPKVAHEFGLKNRVAAFELHVAPLAQADRSHAFTPIPSFPGVKRDVSLVLDDLTTYDAVMTALDQIDSLLAHVELFDVYAGKGIPHGKRSLSFHLTYQSPERTLSSEEADKVHERVMRIMKEKFNAEIRN